jgi:hypothetical protein
LNAVGEYEEKFERIGWYQIELRAMGSKRFKQHDPKANELIATHERCQGEEVLIIFI